MFFSFRMPPAYCRFFDRGHCNRDDNCPFFHALQICKNGTRDQCSNTCMKRHPKKCKYDITCKDKDNCPFRHSNSSVTYVPGSEFENIAEVGDEHTVSLWKIFRQIAEGGGSAKLTFITLKSKTKAQLEVDICSTDAAGENTARSNSPTEIGSSEMSFEATAPCSCDSPYPRHPDSSYCFWCQRLMSTNNT